MTNTYNYNKATPPFKLDDCTILSMSKDREVRLLGEYWEVVHRIKLINRLINVDSKKKRAGMGLSPKSLMAEQRKGMVKYANTLSIRLHYEQGGCNNENVVARAKAILESVPPLDLQPKPEDPEGKETPREDPEAAKQLLGTSVSIPDENVTITNVSEKKEGEQ